MPMFYVEHQFLGILMQISTKKPSSVDTFPCSTWNIAIFIFLTLLFGCKENDPKPELNDSIYQDMTAQEAETVKQLADIEKKIEEAEKTLKESKPQTGEIKRNTNKLFEIKNVRDKIKQQIQFWKIRKFERLKYVRRGKSKAEEADWKNTTAKEYEAYLAEKKLRQAKNSWDLKQRFRDSGFDYNPTLMGEEPKVDKKEKPAAAGGGGH